MALLSFPLLPEETENSMVSINGQTLNINETRFYAIVFHIFLEDITLAWYIYIYTQTSQQRSLILPEDYPLGCNICLLEGQKIHFARSKKNRMLS